MRRTTFLAVSLALCSLFVTQAVSPVPAPVYEYGFIDEQGRVVVRYKYKNARPFSEGLAAVLDEKGWGFIDRQGGLVIGHQHFDARSFHDGLAAVWLPNKGWGFIDKQGVLAIAHQFHRVGHFVAGVAPAKRSHFGQWEFIDKAGKTVIAAQFQEAKDFAEGLAPVAKSVGVDHENYPKHFLKWGYIDRAGKIVIDYTHDNAFPFSEGLAPVEVRESEYRRSSGYIDRQGNLVVPTTHYGARRYQNGRAPVFNGSAWGCLDKTGQLVVAHQFAYPEGCWQDAYPKPELVSRSSRGGGCGCAGTQRVRLYGFARQGTGQFVINPKFDAVEPFSEGRAIIMRQLNASYR